MGVLLFGLGVGLVGLMGAGFPIGLVLPFLEGPRHLRIKLPNANKGMGGCAKTCSGSKSNLFTTERTLPGSNFFHTSLR